MRAVLREPWRTQPQYVPQVDWSNPLTRRLVRLVWFGDGHPIDLVTGLPLTKAGTGIAGTATSKGRGLKNTNETSYWTLPVTTELPNLCSIGWVGAQNGGTSTIILRDATSSGGNIPIWRNAGFDMRLGGTDFTAGGTFSADTVYAVLVASDTASAKLYADGVLVINGGAPGPGAFATPWYLHQNGNSGQGGLSTTLLLPIWDRKLTADDGISWTRNPWQVLAPAGRPVSVDIIVGGGGGGFFSRAYYDMIGESRMGS